jgi:hypothetical protein
MLKQIILFSLAFATMEIASLEPKPFMGIESGLKSLKFNDLKTNANLGTKRHQPHFTFSTGVLVGENVGIEIGAHLTNKKQRGSYRIDSKGLHASLLGICPIIDSVNLIGGIGASHMTSTIENGFIVEVQKVLPRVMGGIEFRPVPTLGVRASTVWHNKFRRDSIRQGCALMYNLGLYYYFE